jgi:nitrite reductase/ring-hydroxylating ferredoxin subunit
VSVDWVEVGSLSDLRKRRRVVVEVGDRQVAVFSHDGEVYALDNVCIHKQRELSKGVILNGRIVCPGHQWSYDLRTGYEQTMDRYQPCFPIKIEDEAVYIGSQERTEACRPSST